MTEKEPHVVEPVAPSNPLVEQGQVGEPAELEEELRFMEQIEDQARGSYCGPLVRHLCRYVLVRGREIVGSFASFTAAHAEGVRRYGVAGGFLIRQAMTDPGAHVMAPTTRVEVAAPAATAAALERAGKPIPQPCIVPALIDTGSGDNLVDYRLLALMGFPAVDRVSVDTSSGGATMGVHACRLTLPALPQVPAWDGVVLGGRLWPRWGCILGRSWLDRLGAFTYCGLDAHWSISVSGADPRGEQRASLRPIGE